MRFLEIFVQIFNLIKGLNTIFIGGIYFDMLLKSNFFIYRKLFSIVFILAIIISCNSKRSRIDDDIFHGGGELAQVHCTSCHVFTPPTLLDKNTWQLNILPRMERRLGMDHHSILNYPNIDILYVCGDNFDYSMILKPYHGIRILENDGNDNFFQKYFFPIYGAAKAEVNDYDNDGDLDIMLAANFADMNNNPERGIMYFECLGIYNYKPYSFTAAGDNQWTTIASGDFDMDGDLDILIGAMYLQNVLTIQKVNNSEEIEKKRASILHFENTMY